MSPGPVSNLSANYQAILNTYTIGLENNTFAALNWSLTVGGLTPGRQYLFQGWVMDPNSGSNANRRLTLLTGGSATSAPIHSNTSTGSENGGLGQYIKGSIHCRQHVAGDRGFFCGICSFERVSGAGPFGSDDAGQRYGVEQSV